MLSERFFVEVNGKPGVAHCHFLEISITVTVDDPLMPSERSTSIPLRRVGNPHVQQASFRLAFTGAPCGTLQYRALFSKSICPAPHPGQWGGEASTSSATISASHGSHLQMRKPGMQFLKFPLVYLQAQMNEGQLTTTGPSA